MQEDRFEVGGLNVHRGDAHPALRSDLEEVRQHLVGIIYQKLERAIFGNHLGHPRGGAPPLDDALPLGVDRQRDAVFLPHQLDQLVVGAAGDQLAVIHDGDVVRQLLGFFHVMGGVEHGHALVFEHHHAIQDAAAGLGVNAHGRLVHVNDLGLVQQRHADVDAPLHAAGVFAHPVFGALGQADQLEHLVYPLVQGRAAQAVHLAPEGQVFARREVFVQGDILRHHAEHSFDSHCLTAHRMPHDEGVAFIGAQQAREHRDGGGFAGAVRPQQAEDLARLRLEADALNGVQLAEALV